MVRTSVGRRCDNRTRLSKVAARALARHRAAEVNRVLAGSDLVVLDVPATGESLVIVEILSRPGCHPAGSGPLKPLGCPYPRQIADEGGGLPIHKNS